MTFSRTRRLVLGASIAAMATSLMAAPAAAQIATDDGIGTSTSLRNLVDFGQVERDAQDRRLMRTADLAAQDRPDIHTTELMPDIVIADPNTPTTARDPVNVTGVGQMIVDERNGFISLCTGTLINPRTVIFAAHCVNERAANLYGQDSGGQPIGFGFSSNNNAAGNSAFGGWLNPGAGQYATNTGRFMYDANYVAYNPLSTQPNAAGFLYGDIALASLDAPAANVPTWALLFSALPAVPITANGTGYHVTIDGYGNNGTGTTGSTGGIDFRRRIAENTLGALASLDKFENFLFGTSSTIHPQNLYWIDFDDPRRGTALASPFDFNAWRDNALPKEGITASGDSGGPLILDQAFARSVVLAVLSGGYTRFFNGQPANGYGTAAFYQPLYLYWDWIAANNPYHYVSALAGNGNWTDPTHWVTNLDPNYFVIGANGQLVNGIPTSPGAGNTTQPGFGQACFQSGGVSDCYDVATNTETVQNKPIGTGATNDPATVSSSQLGGNGISSDDRGTTAVASLSGAPSDQATGTGQPPEDNMPGQAGPVDVLPPATLLNGLPGASNFVPNNDDGNRLTSTAPRYFDVTLSAAGTTTLNSAVTIDRFTIAGVSAMLDIQAAGSLTSLIGVTQGTGTMQVNGLLNSGGDYLMISGGLNGTGTITAPFFTSMAGTIAPATVGTIGTLNFRGNVILASANALLIDLGANGVSDKLAVAATTFNGTTPTNGIANVGGLVMFGFAPGSTVLAGNSYTFLTAQGGVTGTFSSTAALSAILRPSLTYSANSVSVQIQAGLYANVVNPASAVQVSYASLLDADRGNAALANLYGPLDMQSAATIQSFLESAAPRYVTTWSALGVAATENMSRFYMDRLNHIDPGHATGTLAMMGQPLQFAQTSATYGASAAVQTDATANMVQTGSTPLPENMSGYVTAGYIDGDSTPMPAAASAGRDQFNGWFAAVGLERELGDHASAGLSVSYTDLNGDTGGVPQHVRGSLIQGTLYGVVATPSGLRLDGQASIGRLRDHSRRSVSLVGTVYDLRAQGDATAYNAEAGLGFNVAKDRDFSVLPRVSLRYGRVDFDRTQETGGPMALVINSHASESLDGRFGVSINGHHGAFRPYVSMYYVHDFLDGPSVFSAGFVGTQAVAPFALAPADKNWGELAGGFSFISGRMEIGVDVNTTVARGDVRNQSYRGRIGIRF